MPRRLFLAWALIETMMGEYKSRNIFEEVEDELSPVDIITLKYLLAIQVKFLERQLDIQIWRYSMSWISGLEIYTEIQGI